MYSYTVLSSLGLVKSQLHAVLPFYMFNVQWFRCKREWQSAVNLSSHHKVNVVVGAVSSCNRPEPLKHFLYLDFMNREKRRIVWDKLTEAIGKYCA